MVKNLFANVGDIRDSGWIPGNIPWRRAWQPTSELLPGQNPVDRGAWQSTVHGVAKNWTQLSTARLKGLRGGKWWGIMTGDSK